MNILLTNDDGIYAQGLFALYSKLKRLGQVTVVAPDGEKSAVSHGITLSKPLRVSNIRQPGKFNGYGINGTPADCVKIALAVILPKKPDLIISGINLGTNDGNSVIYSGTVAGAREGALSGIPAFAVSLTTFIRPRFESAAKFSLLLARLIIKNGLPPNIFLNVNIPALPLSKLKKPLVLPQGVAPIHGVFHKKSDPHNKKYYWMSAKLPSTARKLENDTNALKLGHITIVPLHCDATAYESIPALQRWAFK